MLPNPPVDKDVSADFPQGADESEMLRLFRRGKVGRCRTRMHKQNYYEVDACYPGGVKLKRVRRYFTSPSAAIRWGRQITQEIRAHGSLVKNLTTGQRWVAADCFNLLAKIGSGEPREMLEVVQAHLKRHPLGGNARTLDDVRRELVAQKTKTGRSERHVKALDYRLRTLSAAIGNKPVTAITTAELAAELENHPDWKPTTVHSCVQSWKILFNFAVRRGYLVENPADRLELPKIIHDEPTILSVDEVKRLLAATLFADRDPRLPACRAYLAIGIFAGLRPDEIARLDWRDLDLATGTIRVKAANAKDRDRRIVDLSPNLVAWLAPLVKRTGKVLPCRIEVARSAARAVLGLAAWPQDVMRHTFASYHFGQHRNEAATKHQMGHRDDGRIFYNHYCVPVFRTEAARFWAISPPFALLPCYDETFNLFARAA